MMRFGFVLLVGCAATAVVGVACSSSSSGPEAPGNDVRGTMAGRSLDAKDSLSYTDGTSTFIAIGDYPAMCTFVTARKSLSNVLVLDIGMSALKAGTFKLGGDTAVSAQYAFYDLSCNSPSGESASTGSVTITRADANGAAGTFDVTMNGDHVTGSFNAPTCAALNANPGTTDVDAGASGTSDEGGAPTPAGPACK